MRGVGLHGGWWEGEEPNLNFASGRRERRRDDGGELEVEAKGTEMKCSVVFISGITARCPTDLGRSGKASLSNTTLLLWFGLYFFLFFHSSSKHEDGVSAAPHESANF